MSDRHVMDEPGNLSDASNPHIQDVIARRFSRRSLLTSLVAAGAVAGLGAAFPLRQVLASGGSTLAFKSLALKIDEKHHVAEGYAADLVIGWGDPLIKGAKPLDLASQTAASQATQFGYNCDFIGYFPLPMGSTNSESGLLFVNHEYTNGELMRPGVANASENRTKSDKAWTEVEIAAHGGAVVEIKKEGGAWKYVADSRFNRRITGATEFAISGPAAGHARLKTAADPSGKKILGMLNNCGGGDAEGPAKGLFKLLFAVPIDAEMCGGAFTPDGKTLFLSVQHPAEGTNFDKPNTRWPDFKDGVPPRPAVVAVHRPDGKEIGA